MPQNSASAMMLWPMLNSEISEFNIGHSIIADALFCGIEQAVREMRLAIVAARRAAAGR